MNPIYKFFIQVDTGGLTPVLPKYKDDLSLDWDLETGQQFYRAKLSGKITFIGDDYDTIMDANFSSTYNMYIHVSEDYGITFREFYKCKFMRTDCTINEDDRKITVQPDVIDQYNDVLAGMEKEFNLIELAPVIQPITIRKRPLIQVYTPGDSIISCFLGGSFWEQDASSVTNISELINKYFFAETSAKQTIDVTISGSPSGASGKYVGGINILEDGKLSGRLTDPEDSGYYIQYDRRPGVGRFIHVYSIYNNVNTKLFTAEIDSSLPDIPYISNATLNAVSGSGASGTASLSIYTVRFFIRYLLDVDVIRGTTTHILPSDDLGGNNRNYKRVIGLVTDSIYIYSRLVDTPTEWGRASNGKYFAYPYTITGEAFYPVARSSWNDTSYWFKFQSMNEFLEQDGWKPYTLRDNYPVSSAISVLLKKIAPGISHEPTEEYSQFLYGARNPLSSQRFRLFVTQKTNIISGEYQQPAQKAPTTLQQFTNMLRDVYKCYWYIEDNKFKIEHIQFFRNGMSYSNNQNVAIDLTRVENIRNGKKWGFNTSEYSYDKVDMAQRYQFEWMDTVTTPFQGLPIEVMSKYVTEGKIEEINIANFTSDIDFMLLNPSEMSQDGFGLFAAISENGLEEESRGKTGVANSDGMVNTFWNSSYVLRSNTSIRLIGSFTLSNIVPPLFAPPGTARIYVNFYNDGGTVVGFNVLGTFSAGSHSLNELMISPPSNTKRFTFQVDGAGTNMSITVNSMEMLDRFELPIVRRRVDGVDYYMQNGYLAFVNLQPAYWLYNMPAMDLEVNNGPVEAYSIERKKKQTLNFPVPLELNPMNLIKTYLGNGSIDKLSINLSSLTSKTVLKYDTE